MLVSSLLRSSLSSHCDPIVHSLLSNCSPLMLRVLYLLWFSHVHEISELCALDRRDYYRSYSIVITGYKEQEFFEDRIQLNVSRLSVTIWILYCKAAAKDWASLRTTSMANSSIFGFDNSFGIRFFNVFSARCLFCHWADLGPLSNYFLQHVYAQTATLRFLARRIPNTERVFPSDSTGFLLGPCIRLEWPDFTARLVRDLVESILRLFQA